MAADFHAIADLLGDAFDLAPFEVSNLVNYAPLVKALPLVESSNGTTHKYIAESGAPVVGFRAENVGREFDSSDDTVVTRTLKILDFSWAVDMAVANAWRKGREHYIAREGLRHIAAALFAFEQQLINGVIGASDSVAASGASGGFLGFRDAATVDALADTMVVTAGAGTADLNSSVWGLRIAEDGVCGVIKGDGDPFELQDTVIAPMISSGTLSYPTYYTAGCTWLGAQIGGAFDIGRIANVSVAVPLTDDMIADLLSKAPVGRGFTHLVMGRRSLKQLQDSRTATNSTGTPAPFPTESFGVPIIVTDGITATEELIA